GQRAREGGAQGSHARRWRTDVHPSGICDRRDGGYLRPMEPAQPPGNATDLPPFVAGTLRTTNRRTFTPEWPNGAKCAASLSVHVDAQTVWGALGLQNLMYVSLGEFGPRVGVWRFLDLLSRLGLKASFFIPAWVVESYPDVAREIVA